MRGSAARGFEEYDLQVFFLHPNLPTLAWKILLPQRAFEATPFLVLRRERAVLFSAKREASSKKGV